MRPETSVPFTFGESSVTPGAASSTSTQLTVNFSGAKTYYVATLPGLSLKNGFSVKFYRGDEPAGGWKTTSATTIARAKIASLGQLDKAACFRYVTVSGAGTKSGRSWANAWGRDELKAFLVKRRLAAAAIQTFWVSMRLLGFDQSEALQMLAESGKKEREE